MAITVPASHVDRGRSWSRFDAEVQRSPEVTTLVTGRTIYKTRERTYEP